MDQKTWPPFSARNRGAHAQIDNECPESTRIGLLHIVLKAVSQHYVEDNHTVVRELERIARVRPDAYSEIDGLLVCMGFGMPVMEQVTEARKVVRRRKSFPNTPQLQLLRRYYSQQTQPQRPSPTFPSSSVSVAGGPPLTR